MEVVTYRHYEAGVSNQKLEVMLYPDA